MTLEYCQNMNNCFGNLVTKQFNRGKKLNQTSRTFGVLRDWEINVASNKSVSTYAIVTVFKPCQQKRNDQIMSSASFIFLTDRLTQICAFIFT